MKSKFHEERRLAIRYLNSCDWATFDWSHKAIKSFVAGMLEERKILADERALHEERRLMMINLADSLTAERTLRQAAERRVGQLMERACEYCRGSGAGVAQGELTAEREKNRKLREALGYVPKECPTIFVSIDREYCVSANCGINIAHGGRKDPGAHRDGCEWRKRREALKETDPASEVQR